MGVSASEHFQPLRRLVDGRLILQAYASVTGDASGGGADVYLTYERATDYLLQPLDIFIDGTASTAGLVLRTGYYRVTPGSSWVTSEIGFTTNSNGGLDSDQSADLVDSLGLGMLWHPGNAAANNPAFQLSMANADGQVYKFAMTCILSQDMVSYQGHRLRRVK